MANQVSKITAGSATMQIPIATTEAPGIAKFNTNDFMVATDGTVTSKQKLGAAQFVFNVLPVIQSTSTGYQYQWSYNTQYPGVNATTLIKDIREILTDMVILYTGPDDNEHDLRRGNLYKITQIQNTGATSVYLFSTNDTGYIGTLRGDQGDQGEQGVSWYNDEINIVSDAYMSWVLPLINLDNPNLNKVVDGEFIFYRENGVFGPSCVHVTAYQYYPGEDGSVRDGEIRLSSPTLNDVEINGVKFVYGSTNYLGLQFIVPAAPFTNGYAIGFRGEALRDTFYGIAYYNNNTSTVVNAEINNSIVKKNAMNEIEHPIGSYYFSNNNTEPAALFSGTWEKVEGYHLRASDSTYPVGTTTGSDLHHHNVQFAMPFFYGVAAGDGWTTDGSAGASPIAGVYNYQSEQWGTVSTRGSVSIKTNVALDTSASSMTEVSSTLKGSEGTTNDASSMPSTLTINVWRRLS